MVVGCIALKNVGDVKDVFNDNDHPGIYAAFIIALGALVTIIAFFGCCGAIRESQCLLNMYSLCLLVIVVLQVLLAIFVFVYNDDIQQAAFRGWDRLWQGRQVASINQQTIDQIQRAIHCCGNNNPVDYGAIPPASCCSTDASQCNFLYAYQVGCRPQIRSLIQNSSLWIAYMSIAMAIVEVIKLNFCLSRTKTLYFYSSLALSSVAALVRAFATAPG